MSPMQRWIDRFQARILWGEFLHRAADGFVIFWFVFGTIVLAVRLTLPHFWPHVLRLAAGALPVAGWAWWWAQKHLQPRRITVAMLDQRLNAGGLLMTLEEQPNPEWNDQLRRFDGQWKQALPRIHPRRFASFLIAPVVFAIAVCFVPLREAQSTPITPQEVAKAATARLEELKESLEQAQILKQEEKDQIQQEIDKIQQEAKDTPLSHENWETLDALQERLQLRVNEAAAKSQKYRNAVGRLANLGKGQDQAISPQEQEQLERDVEEAIDELIKKAKEAEQKLSPGKEGRVNPELQKRLEQLMKDGKPQLPSDPQERQELLNQLKQELEKEKQKLEELKEKARQRARENGEGEAGQEPGDGTSGEDGEDQDGKPGKGGLNRGRGDAEMTWGDETDAKKLKFKEVLLPPGFLDKPKDEISGIQFVAPNDDAAASAAKRALQAGKTSLGDATWSRQLSPKHRNVVKQYFRSEKTK
ncbi:MAG: hypothetical protein JWM11_954 [Planctomycetaceae bacterium]|nr:hypothetical protein [Planctomycetaceae bacterium]